MVGKTRVIGQGRRGRHLVLVAAMMLALVANVLVMPAAPASADPRPTPVASGDPRPTPAVVDTEILTPQQLADQVRAADALRADLMKSRDRKSVV